MENHEETELKFQCDVTDYHAYLPSVGMKHSWKSIVRVDFG